MKKNPDASTLIQTNQYFRNKQNFYKIFGKLRMKFLSDVNGLVTAAVVNTKIGEVEKKFPNVSGLTISAVLNTKIGEFEHKLSHVRGLLKKPVYDAKICGLGKSI